MLEHVHQRDGRSLETVKVRLDWLDLQPNLVAGVPVHWKRFELDGF